MASKIGNILKFTKELEIFTNWTVDGTQKLVVVPKFLKPQKNLISIFLTPRANLKK